MSVRTATHLTLTRFVFRFTAGAFFAVLFVYRGFGIAAGTHALYDIFVSVEHRVKPGVQTPDHAAPVPYAHARHNRDCFFHRKNPPC